MFRIDAKNSVGAYHISRFQGRWAVEQCITQGVPRQIVRLSACVIARSANAIGEFEQFGISTLKQSISAIFVMVI